ncbi:MAG: hypothetical protein ACI9XO_000236 [Paraglaciecola sp.]|jgi:hypothetical protein
MIKEASKQFYNFQNNIKMKYSILKCIVFFLLMIASTFTLTAQNVAGYQGKRFLVEYNFQPSLTGFANGGLNVVHNFQVGYVGTKRLIFGFAYEIFKTDIKDYEIATIKGSAIGVNVDWFIKNNRAPVGPYIHFEFRMMNAENSFGEEISKPIFGGGFGMRRIIKDRIIVNFGSALGWVSRASDTAGPTGASIPEELGEPDVQRLFFYRFNLGVGVLLF